MVPLPCKCRGGNCHLLSLLFSLGLGRFRRRRSDIVRAFGRLGCRFTLIGRVGLLGRCFLGGSLGGGFLGRCLGGVGLDNRFLLAGTGLFGGGLCDRLLGRL